MPLSGKGLGFEFLRHAERTKVILHLIDMARTEGRDPADDYQALNQEMKLYSGKLLDKPQIVVANKMDLDGAVDNLKEFKKRTRLKSFLPRNCRSILSRRM